MLFPANSIRNKDWELQQSCSFAILRNFKCNCWSIHEACTFKEDGRSALFLGARPIYCNTLNLTSQMRHKVAQPVLALMGKPAPSGLEARGECTKLHIYQAQKECLYHLTSIA